MKILICSDSHTRLDYFQKVIDLEEPEMIIFGGDHSTDAIDMSLVYSEIPFKIVRGNTDYFDKDTRDIEIFEVNGKKVFLTHGHLFGVKSNLNEIEKKAVSENADICIFGHTHREYMKEIDGVTYLNPGALQDRKYVIYDGKKFEQKVLK
ncbi:YfcE family phosphodiesterase [Pseudoleptotrichia goodfellowii]|jgi:phosphodiesterase family protein|uniref:Phosphoesterase n=1 Tax=Pseudoleptotrichia goodfellowii F0264 TaxID=596323 RepID=D0GPG1_9FUSO|nr:YfcE family phosphodiesterase [Pseudoleptotrichia goodfellowii]EEY33997.1 phosphodiesterase family protein [Pseudoleptotrichia goodfellowii F0264]MBF4805252.1 YfcE family phosphodiesterase [Pseudoleptotrichia goodfellowii]